MFKILRSPHFSARRVHPTNLLRNRDKVVRNSHFALYRIAELSSESSDRAKSVRNLQICTLFSCQLKLILKNCVQSEDCALF